MLFFIFSSIIFLIWIYCFLIVPLTFWKQKGVKQKGLWNCFVTSWLVFLKRQSVGDMIKSFYDEFPGNRYSGLYQFNAPALNIRDPELIKQITVKDFEYFSARRTYIPEDTDPLFGKSLFLLKGKRWKNLRSTISPTFTSSKLKGMFHLIKECSDNFTKYFLKKELDVVPVQFKDVSGRICSDIIATVAFGISVDSLENQDDTFHEMISRVTDLSKFSKLIRFLGFLLAPRLFKLLNIKFADEDEERFFRSLVDCTIKEREEKNLVRQDMIHLLLQTRHGVNIEEETTSDETGLAVIEDETTSKELTDITNEDITSQTFQFFFAGFELVSTVMCFMAHELAVNQDIQNKLRAEIEDTDEKCNRNVTYEALVRMKYLDMVVSETLRKWPPQTGTERICTKPYTIQPSTLEERPIDLKQGTVVVFPVFGIHRDPEYFPNPERFDPERFNDENKHKIRSYSYLPFGSGPRGCIASKLAILETKIFFYTLLIKFELVPIGKTCVPLKLAKNPALIAVEDGCWLGLRKIKH
ncbi:cytochrome P450 9e2-like [Diorhabda sublineata]|uniref:cytochrome P450 9e2-like n=1 Tax=Diorhabda sublineata TaxID=1163346 RepID=UPI0024E0FE7C|nr:cytochrome P450 9e2-like [Diorhabda sublineata]